MTPSADHAAAVDAVEHADGTVKLTLPSKPASAGLARRLVRDRWGGSLEAEVADIELIVTELISNAIRHGQPEITLVMRVKPFAIDVAVLDHGPDMPPRSPRRADDAATRGRGLLMIDKLALAWGVEPLDGETGKIVWAAVDRT